MAAVLRCTAGEGLGLRSSCYFHRSEYLPSAMLAGRSGRGLEYQARRSGASGLEPLQRVHRHLAGDMVLTHHHEADAVAPKPLRLLGAMGANDQLDLGIDAPCFRDYAAGGGV